jgi:streptomycin 6-kinase
VNTPGERLEQLAHLWRVTVDRSFDTPSSLIAYGRRGVEPVVLKVVKRPGDEWRAGEVTRAFDGHGMVRALEVIDGAALLERLDPGTPLVHIVRRDDDDAATAVLCNVIEAMSPGRTAPCPTVRDWARGFDRYATSTDTQVPGDLVATGHRVFLDLCESQRNTRLLHGDLQHYNVLYDRSRGWVAIDPKGVLGELEYEIGAVLRNPTECSDLLAAPATIERRVALFARRLSLDDGRLLRWAFAQAVLSAIWSVEDDAVVDPVGPALTLAMTIRCMLGDSL